MICLIVCSSVFLLLSFTPSINLSSDRDDDDKTAVTTTTTAATPTTYNYTEPSQMSGFDKWWYKFSTGNNYNLLKEKF